MSNSIQEFTQYSKRIKDKGVPLLGNLVWFSVSELKIDHGTFVKVLEDVGLDQAAPKAPRDDDVFRRVCSREQRKRVATTNAGIFENYLVRDVKRTGGEVWKQIVVEEVDGSNKRLNYFPATELKFTSFLSEILITPLSVHDGAMELARHIRDEFIADRGTLNAYAVRELIRRTILNINGTVVREGGGVYFVMDAQADTVAALEDMASRVAGVTVHSVPLVDDAKQREYLRAAVDAETAGTIDATMQTIDELLAGPPITQRRFAEMFTDMETVETKTQEYNELLDDTVGNNDFRMKNLRAAMMRLMNHTKI